MSDHIHRIITMLSLIPRHPRKKSVRDLIEELRERGFEIGNRRMVERNLEELADHHFPLLRDDNKPAGWSWAAGAQVIDIPCMDPHTALTFKLVRGYLEQLAPRSTLRLLKPHFDKADQILAQGSNRKLSAWAKKIAVLGSWMPLVPAEVDRGVVEAVYSALLDDRKCRIMYRKRGARQAREYLVDPVGLVLRGEQMVLVCCTADHDEPIQMLLHRMQRARVLDQARELPRGVDLERYIAAGGFAYGAIGDPIRLRARFRRDAAEQLYETPLSRDQKISAPDAEHIVVEATVRNDWQLRWWLLSFGDQAEVLAPAALRATFAGLARGMARSYAAPG
ncbi:MAG: WYL domain-containing protein [Deltaproteobacteria bacterium]|nr:WYL domain-containing protein [Deltaproteobacteria bacterium]